MLIAHILRAQQKKQPDLFSRLHLSENLFGNFRRRSTFILEGEDLYRFQDFQQIGRLGVTSPDLNIVVSKYPAYNRIHSPV